jgi:cell division ATPase FtsA
LPDTGSTPIRSGDHVVTKEDIEEVTENAQAIEVGDDRQVSAHDHPVVRRGRPARDRQAGGHALPVAHAELMAIHGLKNRIENAVAVAKNVQLGVTDVAFSGICSALAC